MTQKFWTVYRTTNLVNGKRYYGAHKTEDPYDDYLGSGKLLLRAAEKYGRKNFVKEVLAIFTADDIGHKAAFDLERETVDRELGLPGCYNLKRGGEGGYDYINKHNLHSTKEALVKIQEMLTEDPNFLKLVAQNRRPAVLNEDSLKRIEEGQRRGAELWKGKKHSKTSRELIATAARNWIGKKNSQFGTHWICKNGQERKIKAEQWSFFAALGWKRGRSGVHLSSQPDHFGQSQSIQHTEV